VPEYLHYTHPELEEVAALCKKRYTRQGKIATAEQQQEAKAARVAAAAAAAAAGSSGLPPRPPSAGGGMHPSASMRSLQGGPSGASGAVAGEGDGEEVLGGARAPADSAYEDMDEEVVDANIDEDFERRLEEEELRRAQGGGGSAGALLGSGSRGGTPTKPQAQGQATPQSATPTPHSAAAVAGGHPALAPAGAEQLQAAGVHAVMAPGGLQQQQQQQQGQHAWQQAQQGMNGTAVAGDKRPWQQQAEDGGPTVSGPTSSVQPSASSGGTMKKIKLKLGRPAGA
jgi:hypothetical protein